MGGWGKRTKALYRWVPILSGPNKGKMVRRYWKTREGMEKSLRNTYGKTKEQAESIWLGFGEEMKHYAIDAFARGCQREITRYMTKKLPISKKRNKGIAEKMTDALKRAGRKEIGRIVRKGVKKASEPLTRAEREAIYREFE